MKDLLRIYRDELFNNVVPFWERYGVDHAYGGFFTCLDRYGNIYSTDKYLWLQSRAIWMFARLYNEVAQERRWLDFAQLGMDFVRRYGRTTEGRVYFSLRRDGRPIHIQRKIYSEVFYLMALTEMARATGRHEYLAEAKALFWAIYDWWQHPEKLGRPILSGGFQGTKLADPMVFLSMTEELLRLDADPCYHAIEEEMTAIAERHVRSELKLVLEVVGPDGEFLDTPAGRLINPGHAVELAWFLIHLGQRSQDADLVNSSLQIIDWSMERGWDADYGGLYYFLDCDSRPPIQLEWHMKLWWPITEALYALLLAWDVSGENRFLKSHKAVQRYAFAHLHDDSAGEWFGYLDRRGEPTHQLKGGEWKGFFHLPRALLYMIQLLERRV
jgi:N-acylglucosamine 2-epimerase